MIGLAFVPGIFRSVSALRIVRPLRVARLLRIMPDIRVLMDGMRRAGGPAASLLGLTVLLCYMYAVIGNLIFHRTAPEYFGNLGEGMLTLFELLTLEGWNEITNDLRAASPLGLGFTIVFVLFGTYIVVNMRGENPGIPSCLPGRGPADLPGSAQPSARVDGLDGQALNGIRSSCSRPGRRS